MTGFLEQLHFNNVPISRTARIEPERAEGEVPAAMSNNPSKPYFLKRSDHSGPLGLFSDWDADHEKLHSYFCPESFATEFPLVPPEAPR